MHAASGDGCSGAQGTPCTESQTPGNTATNKVNQHLNLSPFTPFGGMKQSGIGRENGAAGLLNYLEPQTMNTAKQHTTTSLLVGAVSSASKL